MQTKDVLAWIDDRPSVGYLIIAVAVVGFFLP